MTHARNGFDFVQICAHNLAGENRTLLKHAPQHPRQLEVDAEQWLPAHDGSVVHSRNRFSDDFEIFCILQLDRRQIRRRQLRSLGGHFAVAGRPLGSGMMHAPEAVEHSASGTPQVCAAAATSICRPAAPICRMGSQLFGVAVLPPATCEPYLAKLTSACSIRTSFQSASNSSATSIGSITFTPWPTSGFLAVMVTMPSREMRRKALGVSVATGGPV